MIKDALALVLLALGAALSYVKGPVLEVQQISILTLGLLGFFCDAFLISPWGKLSSRLAPVVGLALLLQGGPGLLVAVVMLLVGNLFLTSQSKDNRAIMGDGIRTLGPLGAAACLHLPLPHPFPLLSVILAFVLASLLTEPRRFILRPTLFTLLCSPWLALALSYQSQNSAWSLPLAFPILIGLSRAKDDAFPLLVKLRKALQSSQEQTREESKKVQKFASLLKAANLMARTLESEGLRNALQKAALSTGATGVKVFLPGEPSGGGFGIPLLEGKGKLAVSGRIDETQKDQLAILARIFSTSWENASLHLQVVEALAETKRSQAQMVESSRMAAMGLMAAGVAHEVNTPLGAICLATELAETYLEREPEKVQGQLESIFRATERAQKAVERILYYAKPMGQDNQEAFLVSEVVNDAMDLLSHRIARSQVHVERDLEEGLTLFGERQSFFSLLFNLALNATEAAQDSELSTLWIRSGSTESHIVVEIEDSGSGVSPENEQKIFEAFFTTRPSGEGTGLGLHLARQAAELFGGTLELRPRKAHGAIFRATLPKSPS